MILSSMSENANAIDPQKLNLDPVILEQRLRAIITAYEEKNPNGLGYFGVLEEAIRKGKQALRTMYQCKFQWDSGRDCIEPGVRDVHNIWCCEYHAKIREG